MVDLEQHLVQTEHEIHSAAGEVVDVYQMGGDVPAAIERLKAAFDAKAGTIRRLAASETEGT